MEKTLFPLVALGLVLGGSPRPDGPRAAEGAPAPARDEPRVLFEAGDAAFKKGQDVFQGKIDGDPAPHLREAIRLLEDLRKRFPSNPSTPQGTFLLGSSHLLLDEQEKALAAYRSAFDQNPSWAERSKALVRVGICQAALDQPAQARATFQRVQREFPQRKDDVGRARKYLMELGIVGQPAPPVEASRWLHGTSAAEGLKSFQGETVVVIFFATWCTSCKRELPHIRSLLTRLLPRGVVFLGVANPEDPQSTQGVEPYIQEHRLEFMDVALDPREASWVPYRVSNFPAAVLIDRRGVVRWRGHPAFLSSALVEKVLAERSP